jgi:hypothetical protein
MTSEPVSARPECGFFAVRPGLFRARTVGWGGVSSYMLWYGAGNYGSVIAWALAARGLRWRRCARR